MRENGDSNSVDRKILFGRRKCLSFCFQFFPDCQLELKKNIYRLNTDD